MSLLSTFIFNPQLFIIFYYYYFTFPSECASIVRVLPRIVP
jgi:hypothetical protein